MSAFAKLKKAADAEDNGDRVGGFEAVPSGVYDATIKVAYMGKSQRSDAISVTVVADLNGKELRETIWVTDGKGNTYYTDKQDSKRKIDLPGFTTINDLCLLTTGLPLEEQEEADKVVKIYNFNEKKEVNTQVKTIAGLQGAHAKLGVLRQIVNAQKADDSGNYVNTGKTRTENVIDKVFHAESGRTVTEYRQNVETAEFLKAWSERNTGKDRDRTQGSSGDNGAGASGSGRPGAGAPSPAKKSLFGG